MPGVPTFTVVTPPAPIVVLADARAFPGVPASAPDAFVQAQIDAAIGFLDGPDGWLNRSLGQQTIQCTITPGLGFSRPEPIVLRGGPVLALSSITGLPGGATFGDGTAFLQGDALIICGAGLGPVFGSAPTPVVAQYTAGSPAGAIAVVKQTVLVMVAKLIAAAQASARDPSLRSESVPDVFSKGYDTGGSGGVSASAFGAATLAPLAYLQRF